MVLWPKAPKQKTFTLPLEEAVANTEGNPISLKFGTLSRKL